MPPNWTFPVLIALGTASVVLLAGSWVFARWWCKPKREFPTRTPENYGLRHEGIQFESSGVPLKGWFLATASKEAPAPVIITVHGWSRNAGEWLPLASMLNHAGFAVLMFDARGHGKSGDDGPITIRKFAEDILAALEYLEGRSDVDMKRIGVLGRSIGGASAILAAAEDRRIRALVSCSAFADPEALTRDTLKMLHIPTWPMAWLACRFIELWLRASMKEVAPRARIAVLESPVLLVHGETDTFIRPSNMDELFGVAGSVRKERLLVPRRGHSDVLRDASSRRHIVAFFRKQLPRAGHGSGS